MNRQFIYRSPDVDGGGAGTPEPSLSDLGGGSQEGFDNGGLSEEEIAAKAAKQVGIAGNPGIPDAAAEAAKQAEEAEAARIAAGGKPKDAGDAAGKVETPEEIATREAAEEAAQKAADEAGDDGEEDFYAVVDTLRGDKFGEGLEYPEGVEPTSPEGVVFREQALEQAAMDRFEADLKDRDPRGYAYLLHRQNGGSDKDFYENNSFVLPALEDLKDSVDLQRQVYTEGLIALGNSV